APDEAEPVMELEALAPDEPAPTPVVAPEPDAPSDEDGFASDELPDEEPMVTRTMAELYARQGLTERALHVFRQLLDASPDDAQLRARVAELAGAPESGQGEPPEPVAFPALAGEVEAPEEMEAEHHWTAGAQEGHEVDTPFAWTEPEDREPRAPGPVISEYFGRMLAWEAEGGPPAESEDPA
ncbi:MAG: hypothetical protein AMXMBFR53_17130, partial [Gemmatimonadota bacterium]